MEDVLLTRRGLLAVAAGALAAGTGGSANAGNCLRIPPPTGMVRLRDGRRVAYAEYGNPTGSRVVIYHHGQPCCRLEAGVLLPALARRPDVRLIAFDRPGVGASDPVRHPSFESWACDLTACADALRLGRFGLTGISAGTPFALAAAIRLRDRVTAVSLGCPAAEITRGHRHDLGEGVRGWRAVSATPLLAAAGLNAQKRQVERCPRSLVRIIQPLTPDEERGFDDPDTLRFAAGVFTESMRNGAMGVVSELQLLARPWGLPLADVRVPVSVFHGALDRRARPWMAEELAARLPTATRYLTPTDGHLSLPKNMAGPLLDAAAG